ncbi:MULTISPECIES: nuclease-related domain-containing protein [unclassified Fictibacillus]|uniref:nuclease-related domain-containing protein n=1 Tax=unclassified Fictibacillus TaxID=2644029 RepID=UPI0007830443|nr:MULTISPECIES: nuclease-related domain-containing protein [unclassified Fictibacillus]UZJ79511.1 NERD domain-containing protein [Fictibacillus sp. KU28468]
MIVKELKVPLIIRKLEALLRRLPSNHPQRSEIERQLARRKAGYRGEQSVEYSLSYLPPNKYIILFDLRLYDSSHFFQIDTLLISPHFLLILEVKNFSGTLQFDQEFKQLIRTSMDKEEAFPDPILQVARHKTQLQTWLSSMGFRHQIPIETIVVVSSPHTLIRSSSTGVSRKVTHLSNLIELIKDLEKRYKKDAVTETEIQYLTNLLIKNEYPHDADILNRFQISYQEILKGILCPVCLSFSMSRSRQGWKCMNCDHYDKLVHYTALEDYFLLLGSEITNRKLKEFLQLSSTSAAKRLLLSLNVPHSGSFKDRKYYLSLPL